MTRERCKKLLPILQAYAEGKEIQWNDNGEWKTVDEILASGCEYRIKPEEKFRPYKNCEEMIKDFKQKKQFEGFAYHVPMIWVKDENATSLITDFGVEGDNERVCLGAENYDMEELFNDFTYLDGSPVGAKE